MACVCVCVFSTSQSSLDSLYSSVEVFQIIWPLFTCYVSCPNKSPHIHVTHIHVLIIYMIMSLPFGVCSGARSREGDAHSRVDAHDGPESVGAVEHLVHQAVHLPLHLCHRCIHPHQGQRPIPTCWLVPLESGSHVISPPCFSLQLGGVFPRSDFLLILLFLTAFILTMISFGYLVRYAWVYSCQHSWQYELTCSCC